MGANENRFPTAKSALVLIDLQRDFYDPEGYFQLQGIMTLNPEHRDGIVANIARLRRQMEKFKETRSIREYGVAPGLPGPGVFAAHVGEVIPLAGPVFGG